MHTNNIIYEDKQFIVPVISQTTVLVKHGVIRLFTNTTIDENFVYIDVLNKDKVLIKSYKFALLAYSTSSSYDREYAKNMTKNVIKSIEKLLKELATIVYNFGYHSVYTKYIVMSPDGIKYNHRDFKTLLIKLLD